WFRWAFDKAVPSEAAEQPFILQGGTGLCLLELLPDPLVERYLFSAEVRHDDDGGSFLSQVGVYFAYSKHASAQGEQHCFAVLYFNDKKAWVDLKLSEASLRLLRRPFPPVADGGVSSLRWQRFLPAAGRWPGPWRRLAVEVAPETFRCC